MKIPTVCRYCGGVIRMVPARKIYGVSTDRLGLSNENIFKYMSEQLEGGIDFYAE